MKTTYIYMLIAVVIFIGFIIFRGGNDNLQTNSQSRIGLKVGDISPSFQITTIDGKTVSSNDLKGKVVVITSSAAWCSTCVAEALQFAAVYQKVKDKDIYFLTVDIDPNVTTAQINQFKENTFSPWDYAGARGGRNAIDALRLNRFEITYIIDANGIIRYKDGHITDAETLEFEISKLL